MTYVEKNSLKYGSLPPKHFVNFLYHSQNISFPTENPKFAHDSYAGETLRNPI